MKTYFLSAICLITSLAPATAATLYVDRQISASSCTTYNSSTRQCAGGVDRAYQTMNGASAAAAAGDLVLIRAGTYTSAFSPSTSGAVGSPIVYRNYPAEAVTISGISSQAILVMNRSYLVIDGWTVTNVTSFGRLEDSTHITIQNMTFTNSTGSGTTSGFKLLRGGFHRFLNNQISGASDNMTLIDSHRNLIAGNNYGNGGHSLLTIRCSEYNVVRSNTFANSIQKAGETYDCEGSSSDAPIRYDATHYNVWENNRFTRTGVDDGNGPYNHLQYAGQTGIIRRNVLFDSEGMGFSIANYADEARHGKNNRIYHNVFYNNYMGGIETASASSTSIDNIFKNNILFRNRPGPLSWASNNPSGSQISHRSPTNYLFIRNNIINLAPGETSVIRIDGTLRSLAQVQTNYSSVYAQNIELDPLFVSPSARDFTLTANSPMIDAGHFLTATTNSGSGTVIPVADTLYFFDGNGIPGELGDEIQLQGQTQTARIVSIDRAGRTLSLDRPLSWTSGLGIAQAYQGSAPDLGAFESGSVAPPPPPPSSNRCDVNGSGGAANVTDVQICVNQAIQSQPCNTGDINQNGTCDVVDVQRVVNNALGGLCVTQ